ncbi:MAG: hypothetical protein ACYC7B_06835 [Burkholderiales bacterium]
MQNDKNKLDVDLGFLDEAKPRDAETNAASSYKINWRNIAIIGGLIIAIIIWVNLDDKSSTPRRSPTPVASAPAYQPPADTSGTVRNGQYHCSRYDSDQADRLSPVGESDLTMQQQTLERRSNALDSLKTQISLNAVNQYSDQSAIDSYNALVDRYNAQLTAFKADAAVLQSRIDQFNAQVQAHNNYLIAHCRSGG